MLLKYMSLVVATKLSGVQILDLSANRDFAGQKKKKANMKHILAFFEIGFESDLSCW
jgi:hypothetical protein